MIARWSWRWGLHGGPGTGKSHVIQIIKRELFEQVLQRSIGVDFQIVALQAVMADLLEGDTFHHALGHCCRALALPNSGAAAVR